MQKRLNTGSQGYSDKKFLTFRWMDEGSTL